MRLVSSHAIASSPSQDDPAALEGLAEVGAITGGVASLGGVVGLVLATVVRTVDRDADIQYGEWIEYSAALAGLFALSVEIVYRAS